MSKKMSKIMEDNLKPVDQDWNASQIAFQMDIAPMGREKLNFKNADECIPMMQERLAHYLKCCEKYGKRVGNISCYMALGIARQDVDRILNGTAYYKIDTRIKDFLKDIKAFCATYREGLGSDGKLNPATLIFWQKNFDGLKDQQEVVNTINVDTQERSYEELESKYSKLIVTDAVEVDD